MLSGGEMIAQKYASLTQGLFSSRLIKMKYVTHIKDYRYF